MLEKVRAKQLSTVPEDQRKERGDWSKEKQKEEHERMIHDFWSNAKRQEEEMQRRNCEQHMRENVQHRQEQKLKQERLMKKARELKDQQKPTSGSCPATLESIVPEDATSSYGLHLQSLPQCKALLTHARTTPKEHAGSVSSLSTYLTKKAVTEEEKAWVIFSWICHHVEYDVDGFRGRSPKQPNDAESVLKNRLCVCAGYSRLFESLCKEAGLVVEYITGYARTSDNEIGAKLTDKDLHAWNAVNIDGKWALVDSTWGAGSSSDTQFIQSFKPHYFGAAPKALAYSHFPEKTEFQLLSPPITNAVFLSQPHVWGAPFFELGLGLIPERPSGAILLKGSNQSSLQLKVPDDVQLMTKLDNGDDRCFQKRSDGIVTIYFRCPKGPAHHKLTVYAKRGSSTKSYDGVCRFSVTGSVGPSGFVEPWFPHVWYDALVGHRVEFENDLPCGLLKPDVHGSVSVRLRVPIGKELLAHLEGKDGSAKTKEIPCQRMASDSNMIEITCPAVTGYDRLVVFAKTNRASSFEGVLSYRIGTGTGSHSSSS